MRDTSGNVHWPEQSRHSRLPEFQVLIRWQNSLHLGDEIILDRPKARRPVSGYLTMLAALLSVGGASWAWHAGYRPPFSAPSVPT